MGFALLRRVIVSIGITVIKIRRRENCLIFSTKSKALIISYIYLESGTRAPFQYPLRRFIVRSCKISKPRDSYLKSYDRSGIWRAPRQHCCRRDCQISKRYGHFNTRSRVFETLRDFTIRRLNGYWNGAQGTIGCDLLLWQTASKTPHCTCPQSHRGQYELNDRAFRFTEPCENWYNSSGTGIAAYDTN